MKTIKDEPDTSIAGCKSTYRAIKAHGFEWGGWLADEGLHLFQKGNYRDGFYALKCRDSECFDGSFELMAREGLTR